MNSLDVKAANSDTPEVVQLDNAPEVFIREINAPEFSLWGVHPLEVFIRGVNPSEPFQAAQYREARTSKPSEEWESLICGLREATFFLALVLAIVIVVVAIGGGIGTTTTRPNAKPALYSLPLALL